MLFKATAVIFKQPAAYSLKTGGMAVVEPMMWAAAGAPPPPDKARLSESGHEFILGTFSKQALPGECAAFFVPPAWALLLTWAGPSGSALCGRPEGSWALHEVKATDGLGL